MKDPFTYYSASFNILQVDQDGLDADNEVASVNEDAVAAEEETVETSAEAKTTDVLAATGESGEEIYQILPNTFLARDRSQFAYYVNKIIRARSSR